MKRTFNNTHHSHMSDSELRTMLFGDEHCLSTSEISSHVETCELCQRRLEHLDPLLDTENEIGVLLANFTMDDPKSFRTRPPRNPGKSSDEQYDDEVALGPPSHPEMLGRLGRYEIERKIGSGGMGVVFKAIDTDLNRPVAIKVLAPYLARNGAARQRFGRESRAAAAVVHEHVVGIYNVESDGETPFIVMQYVSGESLQARVQRRGPLSTEEILRIGIQTASGLAAAHEQGIVHRDVKPENILLENTVERVLLTDFGLARIVDDASLTHTGVIAGTPNYMSPEQANGDHVDHRTDLFSFGSVLYFVATGHPPFRAERAMGVLHRICHSPHRPVWQVNPKVPTELSEIIDRLLEKNPSNRFGSANGVRDSLTRLLAKVQNGKPPVTTRVRSWIRRHQRLAGICAAATLASFLLTGIWLNSLLWNTNPANTFSPKSVKTDLLGESEVVDSSQTIAKSTTRRTPTQNWVPTIVELAPAERAEFNQSLRQLHGQLNRLEYPPSEPSDGPQSENWKDELRSIERVLSRIGRN
jgi:eukaryotic-like serine/threonine-protein kinase